MPTPPSQSPRPTTCKRSLKRKRYRTRCRFMAERVMASMASTGRMLAAAPWLSCRGTSRARRCNENGAAGAPARRTGETPVPPPVAFENSAYGNVRLEESSLRNFLDCVPVPYTEGATEVSNVRISGLVPSVRDVLAAGTARIGGLPICVADSVAVPHSWDRRAWRACPGCVRDHASSPSAELPLPLVALKAASGLQPLGSGLQDFAFGNSGAPEIVRLDVPRLE